MSCSRCSSSCNTVLSFYNVMYTQTTEIGRCSSCGLTDVATPLGYEARIVKGKASKSRTLKTARLKKAKEQRIVIDDEEEFRRNAKKAKICLRLSILATMTDEELIRAFSLIEGYPEKTGW